MADIFDTVVAQATGISAVHPLAMALLGRVNISPTMPPSSQSHQEDSPTPNGLLWTAAWRG